METADRRRRTAG